MAMKSLGMSLWGGAGSRSSTGSTRSSSVETSPVGFGLPSLEDPDPFGVKALEMAGLAIKEAGSNSKPNVDEFSYKPSPTSPVFRLSTQSFDAIPLPESRRNSKRHSKRSSKGRIVGLLTGDSILERRYDPAENELRSQKRESQPVSRSVRTSVSLTRSAIPSPTTSSHSIEVQSPTTATFAIDAGIVASPTDVRHSRSLSLLSNQIHFPETINETVEDKEETHSLRAHSIEEVDEPQEEQHIEVLTPEVADESEEDYDEDEEDDYDDEDDIIIEEVSASVAPIMPTLFATPIAVKAKVVSIGPRGPPALPMKNPRRARYINNAAEATVPDNQDEVSSEYSLSPNKSSFDKTDESAHLWSEQTSMQDSESIKHLDIGNDIVSVNSTQESGRKSPVPTEEIWADAEELSGQESTPTSIKSELTLPLATIESKQESTNDHEAQISTVESSTIKPIVERNTAAEPNHSEHKSSISGSTLASLSEDKPFTKTNSVQSLANMIMQGLSTHEVEEEENIRDEAHKYYYHDDEPTSDYEDDVPLPIFSNNRTSTIPGAFDFEPLH